MSGTIIINTDNTSIPPPPRQGLGVWDSPNYPLQIAGVYLGPSRPARVNIRMFMSKNILFEGFTRFSPSVKEENFDVGVK